MKYYYNEDNIYVGFGLYFEPERSSYFTLIKPPPLQINESAVFSNNIWSII